MYIIYFQINYQQIAILMNITFTSGTKQKQKEKAWPLMISIKRGGGYLLTIHSKANLETNHTCRVFLKCKIKYY